MEKIPSGSQSVLETGSSAPEVVEPVAEEVVPEPAAANPLEAKIASLAEQLANAQKLIGKQSGEVKAVREMQKELESLKAKQEPQGPSIEDQIDSISARMEEGELSLREGNKLIAQLSARMGQESALSVFTKQRQQEEAGKIQNNFLEKNPDFAEARDSGELDSYMKANPLHDEFSAYHEYKADKRIQALETEYAAKIAAAKEEGAKLASGADNAGKVLGKSGATVRPTGEVKKFNNPKEATAAMEAELAKIRSVSG
jgi:chromosome segregation ATPase